MSKEEIVSGYTNQTAKEADNLRITASATKNPDELEFDLLNHGYLLTRYFKLGEKWYCVFEQKSAEGSTILEKRAA